LKNDFYSCYELHECKKYRVTPEYCA